MPDEIEVIWINTKLFLEFARGRHPEEIGELIIKTAKLAKEGSAAELVKVPFVRL